MKTKEREAAVTAVICDLHKLAKQHGVDTTRAAIRRWDKHTTLKRKLAKRKAEIERELEGVNKRLGA